MTNRKYLVSEATILDLVARVLSDIDCEGIALTTGLTLDRASHFKAHRDTYLNRAEARAGGLIRDELGVNDLNRIVRQTVALARERCGVKMLSAPAAKLEPCAEQALGEFYDLREGECIYPGSVVAFRLGFGEHGATDENLLPAIIAMIAERAHKDMEY